ncbi:hypothetical protein [Thiolapillus sp.]|uniref:hypothetical protein n=1 Tax=Thiolapillus sp. TaxID=2017437 RepID=UPI003AF47189
MNENHAPPATGTSPACLYLITRKLQPFPKVKSSGQAMLSKKGHPMPIEVYAKLFIKTINPSVSLPRDRFWDIQVPYMVSSRFARLNNPNDRDKIASIYPACLRRM